MPFDSCPYGNLPNVIEKARFQRMTLRQPTLYSQFLMSVVNFPVRSCLPYRIFYSFA